jgi:hypothetical protein
MALSLPLVFETSGDVYGIQSWAININLAEAAKCWVLSVDHRKAYSSKEHEFLSIHLCYPPSFETYITAERCVRLGSKSSLVLLIPSLFRRTPASDSVQFSAPHDGSYSLRRWEFNHRRPSVADLCSILYAVSIHSPYYRVGGEQCFWFASTVYGVLTEEYSGRQVGWSGKRQATCRGLPIPSANSSKDVEFIRQKYRWVWADFLAKKQEAVVM